MVDDGASRAKLALPSEYNKTIHLNTPSTASLQTTGRTLLNSHKLGLPFAQTANEMCSESSYRSSR